MAVLKPYLKNQFSHLLEYIIIPLLVLLFIASGVSAQIYGLGFSSHSALKEYRTQLDLNPNHFFTFHAGFTLVFKLTLRQNEQAYFGYIVRLIDDKNKNVDLLYSYRTSDRSTFDLVYGEQMTSISARSDFNKISTEWIDIQISYDYNKRELRLIGPDTTLVAAPVDFSQKIKILFGATDYNLFKSTDVPPMNIRDIQIFHGGNLIHEWPLNESAGNIAFDLKGNINALTSNPIWLKPKFQDWTIVLETVMEGFVETAFNEEEEILYLIGNKFTLAYSIKQNTTDTIFYQNIPEVLKQGCQAIYDREKNTIISYDVDLKTISTLDLLSGEWTQMVSASYPLTEYWHHNKYYSSHDSLLYVLGGYGQHVYKNSIFKYSFLNKQWDTISATGTPFYPRYLAALGYLNDTLYVAGGYGSKSGKQIINPQIYDDMFSMDLKKYEITSGRNFNFPLKDVALANSMIIDPVHRDFYILAFPFFKYESSLQLMKGNLDNQEITLVGNKIPYLFHDILSFADLFFCKNSRHLVCATILNTAEKNSLVKIFTLGYPPSPVVADKQPFDFHPFKSAIILLFVVLIIGSFVFIFIKLKSLKSKGDSRLLNPARQGLQNSAEGAESLGNDRKSANSILFFGDFQIFNRDSSDITIKFSPLLKELFLLIWLYSIKDKGISSERIIELLWFDKDEKSAKNNLAVNIVKLKTLLSELDNVELSKHTGYWKIVFRDEIVYNDYWSCIKIAHFKSHLDKTNISKIISIAQKGHFLESSAYDWLDEFKADISNTIIDTLELFSEKVAIEEDSDFILRLADTILHFDLSNEAGIRLKCRALTMQGKHNMANEVFTKFTRDYKNLYNEYYGKTLPDLLGNH